MTVLTFLTSSAELIDEDVADYYTGHFNNVTTIMNECVRSEIGIHPDEYKYDTTGTMAYTPTDTYYQPISLPADLTDEEQITGVRLEKDGTYDFVKTETHSGSLYLLIPATYSGAVIVRYINKITAFTSLTETIPISDSAAYTVARYGMAKLMSIANAPQYTDMMASEYLRAKSEWKRKNFNGRKVKGVYNYG